MFLLFPPMNNPNLTRETQHQEQSGIYRAFKQTENQEQRQADTFRHY